MRISSFLVVVPVAIVAMLPAALSAQNADVPPPVVIDAGQYETLQQAFDAVPESGGIVKLPPRTFEITQPLLLSTPETRLTGSGPASHIKNLNTEGAHALLVQPKDRDTNARSRLWRVQLDNFRISGNEKSGDGIHAEGIQELYLHGVSVDHHGGHGIYELSCSEDPRIADSIITYNKKAGVYIDGGHDIVVNANHFEENQDALVCVDSFNLCMNGNNLDDHLGNGVIIENTYGSVVSGNMIEECNGTAIILDRNCYGVTLSANVIAHDMGGGIDLRDAHGCAVSANTFTLMHKFGVRVSSQSGRITIAANNFSNSYVGDGKIIRKLEHENPLQLDIGHGVLIEDAKHVAITGNIFSGLDGPALKTVGACQKIALVGNVVTDLHRRPEEGSSRKAFEISPDSDVTAQSNLTD